MNEKDKIRKLIQDAIRIKQWNKELKEEIKQIEDSLMIKRAEIIANNWPGKYENND